MTNSLLSSTVMVVDDEALICRLFEKVLGEEGYRVIIATSGREALTLAAQAHPQVILLDLVMPEMDGVATFRELKKQEAQAVVIILTAKGTLQSARESMMLGAFGYVTKPFDLRFIKLTLQDGLAEYHHRQREAACAL